MMRRIPTLLRVFWGAERGAAAVELVLWTSAMILPVVNVVDLGVYVFQRMQVETAAHAAVNAAWHDCDITATTSAPPPAITTCKAAVSSVITDMQTAAQSTSLGNAVTLATADISEGYYCADSTGALTLITSIGTAASPPSKNPSIPTCAGSTTLAGDYILATVNYTYTPLFSSASIVSVLGTNIQKTAWMRLDK